MLEHENALPLSQLPLSQLRHRLYKNLLVCREVFRQQLEMFANNSNRIDNRIVSLSQPHVRPIKRGKAGRETEFGAKLSLSLVHGNSFVDRRRWDNYNEGGDLIGQIERYRKRFGFYPLSVHVDKIYRPYFWRSSKGEHRVLQIAWHSHQRPTVGATTEKCFQG